RAYRARKETVSSSSTSPTDREHVSPPSSTTGSMPPSAERVRTIAVVGHGDPKVVAGAMTRLEAITGAAEVEIVDGDEADLAVVLGGDGTMLRALHRFLGMDVPVMGVNFGRVGFLSAMQRDQMEEGLRRAFAGEFLGVQPCDGVICASPTGSTAYNLSSGGPVLVWGIDAMAVTFVSPHSLHARP